MKSYIKLILCLIVINFCAQASVEFELLLRQTCHSTRCRERKLEMFNKCEEGDDFCVSTYIKAEMAIKSKCSSDRRSTNCTDRENRRVFFSCDDVQCVAKNLASSESPSTSDKIIKRYPNNPLAQKLESIASYNKDSCAKEDQACRDLIDQAMARRERIQKTAKAKSDAAIESRLSGPPKFEKHPESVTIALTDVAYFGRPYGSNFGTQEISWQKKRVGGQWSAYTPVYTNTVNGVMQKQFKAFIDDHNAMVRAVATNRFGTTYSNSAKITIRPHVHMDWDFVGRGGLAVKANKLAQVRFRANGQVELYADGQLVTKNAWLKHNDPRVLSLSKISDYTIKVGPIPTGAFITKRSMIAPNKIYRLRDGLTLEVDLTKSTGANGAGGRYVSFDIKDTILPKERFDGFSQANMWIGKASK